MLLNQPRLTPPKEVSATSVTPAVVTGTTDALLPGMSLVTPYRATWSIDFSSSLVFGSNGDVSWASIYVGGVQIPSSQRSTGATSSGEGGMMSCTGQAVDVPAGTTIEVRARVNSAASATYYERQLRIHEVSP